MGSEGVHLVCKGSIRIQGSAVFESLGLEVGFRGVWLRA